MMSLHEITPDNTMSAMYIVYNIKLYDHIFVNLRIAIIVNSNKNTEYRD